MFKKLVLLIMSIFLLIQLLPYAHAKAISSEVSSESNPRILMFVAIISELTTLSTFALKESIPIYKKVIIDLDANSEKSEEFQGYVKSINDFIASVEKYGQFNEVNDDVINAYFKFFELTSKFVPDDDDNEKQQISADATIVKESLEKNGIEQLEKDLEKHFDKFAKALIESIEKYAETLNDEEKAKDSKFFAWFKKFKDADETEAKMLTLLEFLDFFKDESSAEA